MTDNVSHFSSQNSFEQDAIRDETGFNTQQAIDLIDKNISSWKENDRLDCLIIRAILKLSKENTEGSRSGFTSWDLVDEVTKLRGKQWSTSGDKDRMSDDVRKQWPKIISLWESKLEGISQSLSDVGFTIVPQISRLEGGGTGRPTKYRLDWKPLATQTNQPPQTNQSKNPSEFVIRYICEDLKNPGFIIKLYTNGIISTGWKRILFVVCLLIPGIILLISFLILLLNLAFYDSIATNKLGRMFTNVVMWGAIVLVISPLYFFSSKRIFIAPWWMQPDDDERLLEYRSPPRFESKSLNAVTYSSECPICGGKIKAKSGGIEFWGRIVGRCTESPKEHVFSFDHVTRQGRFLRK